MAPTAARPRSLLPMDTPSPKRTHFPFPLMRHRRAPPGSAPGTLIADPTAAESVIKLIQYGEQGIVEERVDALDGLADRMKEWPVTWVDIEGMRDVEMIWRLGEMFGLHRLALEDTANAHQRPKFDDYGDHVFIVTRMVRPETAPATEQVAMFVGSNFLITIQERPGDCFEPVRDRLRRGQGPIRTRGPDYLAYALLDAVLDNYFPVLETYGERVETLETDVIAAPVRDQVVEIHQLKRELLAMRRAVWPQREMVNAMIRDEARVVSDQTRVYLRDCYDHTVQLMDIVEVYREITSGLVDIYLSSLSARMNEVMKVLTIIATIFIPLSFVAGVYGMNFSTEKSPWNMPELKWAYGYIYSLVLMLVIAGGLLFWFWRKGWLIEKKPPQRPRPRPRRRR
jgi:magnesium transporter